MNQSEVTPLWSAIPGWTDENMFACYDRLVASAKDYDTIVEVGSFLGRSLCYLCSKVKASGKNIRVYSVDLFPDEVQTQVPENKIEYRLHGGTLEIVRANLYQGGFQYLVEFLRGDSADNARYLVNESLYACYIDGDHTYEGVLRDVRAWLPKVRKGGWLCGHDYGAPGTDGVKMAVDEILGEKNVKQTGSTWMYKV